MSYKEEDYEIKLSKDLGIDFNRLENTYVQFIKNKKWCPIKITFI
ncbi:MAG: hypothetical protein ACOCP8_09475 [archaeon]